MGLSISSWRVRWRPLIGCSPTAVAAPVVSVWVCAITPTSASGMWSGPTHCCLATSPVTDRSTLLVRKRFEPTDGSRSTRSSAEATLVPSGSSSGAVLRGVGRPQQALAVVAELGRWVQVDAAEAARFVDRQHRVPATRHRRLPTNARGQPGSPSGGRRAAAAASGRPPALRRTAAARRRARGRSGNGEHATRTSRDERERNDLEV